MAELDLKTIYQNWGADPQAETEADIVTFLSSELGTVTFLESLYGVPSYSNRPDQVWAEIEFLLTAVAGLLEISELSPFERKIAVDGNSLRIYKDDGVNCELTYMRLQDAPGLSVINVNL